MARSIKVSAIPVYDSGADRSKVRWGVRAGSRMQAPACMQIAGVGMTALNRGIVYPLFKDINNLSEDKTGKDSPSDQVGQSRDRLASGWSVARYYDGDSELQGQ